MNDRSSRTSGGGGGLFLLFLAFLVLKLTHVIDWSWWWITASLWGPTALVVLIVGAMAGFVGWSPSKRRHLGQREAQQEARRKTMSDEVDARLRAADEARARRNGRS